jgi:tRNA pseudouridine55 synthase
MGNINGILPINKPLGISSFDVIRQLKKRLSLDWKDQKIGHGGTLDRGAGGVLPILLGEASKAFDYLLLSEKVYRAVVQFGACTVTGDASGEFTGSFDRKISRHDLEEILPQFIGRIKQVPPAYSSLHVNGRRSYELALKKIKVENEAREIEINDIIINDFDFEKSKATMTVICSSGTYIRSLARDMGDKMECGGYIEELTRLSASGISLEDCISVEDVNDSNISWLLIPLNDALHLDQLTFLPEKAIIESGRALSEDFFAEKAVKDGLYKVVKDGLVLAIIEKAGEKFHYLRVFNE